MRINIIIMSLKQLWNKSRVVSVFYFSFISHVRASEIKLKQICFISVLFHIYCKSRLSYYYWPRTYLERQNRRPLPSPNSANRPTRTVGNYTTPGAQKSWGDQGLGPNTGALAKGRAGCWVREGVAPSSRCEGPGYHPRKFFWKLRC